MAKRDKTGGIPDQAKHFEQLPDCALIDIAVVQSLTCKSRATVYRWVADGRLPRPKKIGPTQNSWVVGDIRRALGM